MSRDDDEPRRRAWRILTARTGGRVSVDAGDLADLAPAERHRVTDLVQGVRRHTFLLDAILRSYLERPVRLVSPPAREALRLGLYELLYRPRAPRAGIVSRAVDLAGRRKALRGLVNAVLRRIAGELAHEEVEPDRDRVRDRRVVWVGAGLLARFPRPVLPDPARHPLRWLGLHYSLTEEFVAAMVEELPLEHEALFRALVARRPVALRPRVGTDDLEARLRAEGAEPLRWCGPVLEVRLPGSPGELAVVREGAATVQDRCAAEVAPFVDPRPGERILDLGAAPGGKTVHLAELLGNRGALWAVDRAGPRLERLRENLRRAGHEGVRVAAAEEEPLAGAEPFDRVLVDVPCSNTGVLMKRVDARYRVRRADLERLGVVQRALLEQAAAAVRPGGILVYSTCSILPEENGLRVREWLAERREFALEEERLRYPHRTERDGGYAARLRREGPAPAATDYGQASPGR